MRKYKKGENISICPESLRRIIDGVNHLPVNADEIQGKLIELAIVAAKQSPDGFYATSDFYRAEVKNLGLEKEVLDYLIGEMPTHIMMGFVAQNFNELVLAKPVLLNIAEISREAIETYDKKAFVNTARNRLYRAFAFNHTMKEIRFSGTLQIDGDGCVRPNLSGLPLILQKETVPLFRIRICPVCQLIFWAKRFDAKTCGEKECVKTLGGNKYQSENKDKINEHKRRKYYEDNDIDFCPKCVRPLSTHGESNCQLNGVKNNGTL